MLSSALTTDAVQERHKPPAPPWPPLSPRSCHAAVEAFSVNPALLPDTIEYRKRMRLLRACMRGLRASHQSNFSVSPFPERQWGMPGTLMSVQSHLQPSAHGMRQRTLTGSTLPFDESNGRKSKRQKTKSTTSAVNAYYDAPRAGPVISGGMVVWKHEDGSRAPLGAFCEACNLEHL